MQGYFEHSIQVLKNAGVWLLLCLLILSFNAIGWLAGIRGGLERGLTSVDARAVRLVGVATSPYTFWKQLRDGKRRIANLEEQVALLATELAQKQDTLEEIEALRALVPLLQKQTQRTFMVRLIETDQETRIATHLTQTIEEGMVVVDTKGVLIGKVKTVGNYSALVERPFDRESRIPVSSIDGRVHGVLTGDGKQAMLTEVLQGEPLERGAVLVSSGVGGVYPAGIVIGQVELVTGTAAEVTKGALVTLLHTEGDYAAVME